MDEKFTVQEILSAIDDLAKLRNNTVKLSFKKQKEIEIDNSDIPLTTIKLIEEAENN